jgi:hypothetical protein
MVDFQASAEIQMPQGFTHGWMLNLIDLIASFYERIDDSDSVLEKRRQVPAGQVTVLVDGRR